MLLIITIGTAFILAVLKIRRIYLDFMDEDTDTGIYDKEWMDNA